MIGVAVFLTMNVAALVASSAIALRLRGQRDLAQVTLVGVVTWIVLTHTIVLGCGLAGVLHWPAALVVVLLAAAGTVGLTRLSPGEKVVIHHGDPTPETDPLPRVIRLFLIGGVLVFGAYWLYYAAWAPSYALVWDDQTYHAVYPVAWMRAGRLDSPAFNYKAFYPQAGGLVSLWYMLPWGVQDVGGIAWVNLAAIVFAVLFMASAATLCSRLECRGWAWLVPTLLFLSSPIIFRDSTTFSHDFVGMSALLVAAAAIAVPPASPAEDKEELPTDAAYAGLLGGLTVGFKPTAVVPVAILFLAFGVRAWRVGRLWALCQSAALAGAGAILTGSFWYIRNWIQFGNPLYPAKLAGLPGVTDFPETRLVEFARLYGSAETIRQAMVQYTAFPTAYGVIALAGALVSIVALFRLSSNQAPSWIWYGTVCGITVVTLVSLPWQPFGAGWSTDMRSGLISHKSHRYLIHVAVFGWVSVGTVVGARRTPKVLAICGVLLCGMVALSPVLAYPKIIAAFLAALGLAMIGVNAVERFAIWQLARRHMGALALITLVIAAGFVAARSPKKSADTLRNQMTPVFAALDAEPPGAHVCAYGSIGNHWILALFGGHYQHVPVLVDENGLATDRPEYEMDVFAHPPPSPTVTPNQFMQNLRESKLTHVITQRVSLYGAPAKPPQESLLEQSGTAVPLAQDAEFTLWKLPP